MANRDLENGNSDQVSATQNTDTSSESSESLESYSERISLLPPDYEAETSNYKSTTISKISGENEADPSAQQLLSPRGVFAILSLLFIGIFISNADGTLVLATYGTISSEFGEFENASWLTTSFSLAACATQPLTGKLSDIYGRKIVLLTSYFLFGGGCVVCGLARCFWQVIAGRVISGIGAAGMTVLVSILITDLVPLIQVASWRSYVNVVATLGRSIGGPTGGVLADTFGWRWSFTGQGPLIIMAIFLVASKLPPQDVSPTPNVPRKGQPSKLRRIDFVGALSLAVAIVLLLGALSLGGQRYPWQHAFVVCPIVASSVILAFFVRWETKHALEPVFPPSLVIQRDVATTYGIMTLQLAAQTSMMYSVPLYFRATQNSSNTAAGSHLFPAVVGNAIRGLLSGFIIQRTGKYKTLTISSAISSSLSYFLLITRWNGHISLFESLYIVPGGFGQGMAQASTFMHSTSSIEPTEIAMATGGMYLSGSMGMVISLAASSAIQMSTLNILLLRGLQHLPYARKIIRTVLSDVGSIAKLDESVRNIVVGSYVKSLEYSHMFSLACSLTALALSLTIREHRLR